MAVAELDLDGTDLVVKLSTVEKAEAVHGDIRVPVSAVRSVEVVTAELRAQPIDTTFDRMARTAGGVLEAGTELPVAT